MIVRITEGFVVPGREADFSAVARTRRLQLLEAQGILSCHMGRRVTEAGTEFVFVTLWCSFSDLVAATGDREATSRLTRDHPELFARIASRHFEAFDDAADVGVPGDVR